MRLFLRPAVLVGVLAALGCGPLSSFAGTFRVATYNLESYVEEVNSTRPLKSLEARAKIRENIRALKPDVIALQEVGSQVALEELRDSLRREGLEFPHIEYVRGFDTNVHVALLSRLPLTARRSHTNDSFLLNGRRFRVSRGIAEVDVQVGPQFSFTLLVAHLKSKRVVAAADEAEMRLEEAKVLREKVDALLASNPNALIVVAGDLNDTKDAASTRAVIGRGRSKLVDTRPAERNGDNLPSPNPAWEPRNITWTHYYGKEDSYSRIDYLLLSPAIARVWVPAETYVLASPNWGLGSDHRPLLATFEDGQP